MAPTHKLSYNVSSATRAHEHVGVLCYKRSFSEQKRVLEVFGNVRPPLLLIFLAQLKFKPFNCRGIKNVEKVHKIKTEI